MAAITSRSVIHNLNELERLEKRYFVRLEPSTTKTVNACGHELRSLALYYKKYVVSRRLGIDTMTCEEIEHYFNNIAAAMEQLLGCIRNPPLAIHHIYHSYEHGHTSWSLSGGKRSSDANNLIMQSWHDGHAGSWFLTKNAAIPELNKGNGDIKELSENRLAELEHLMHLMKRLSKTYQELKVQQSSTEDHRNKLYDEKDALVFNLAELVKKKARPVSHVIDIATMTHEWATGDPNSQQARFLVAFKKWKSRP